MMRKELLLLPALVLSLAAPGAAAPSYLGPTGLIFTPTAGVAPMRSWSAHGHGTKDLTLWGVDFGLTDAIEVGATLLDPSPGGTRVFGNGKWQVTKEKGTSSPAIAIGVIDVADSIDTSVYGVISKGFGRVALGSRTGIGLRASVGYGTGLFDDNIFGGAELLWTDKLTLMGEYDGRDINVNARLMIGRGVHADLGLLDGRFGGGLAYSAGF